MKAPTAGNGGEGYGAYVLAERAAAPRRELHPCKKTRETIRGSLTGGNSSKR